MKLVMDERRKHRIIGIIVIVSLATVFMPAIMKRSNEQIDERVSLSVRLPDPPKKPQVAMPNKETLFKQVQVAKADITLDEAPIVLAENRVKAQPIETLRPVQLTQEKPIEQLASNQKKLPQPVKMTKSIAKPAIAKAKPKQVETVYAIQLASFSSKSNAENLVKKLRQLGHTATYQQSKGKNGNLYKVIVGQLAQRNQALDLQKKLAVSTQLHGFIIKTEVI